jgi:hypothetical protein
MAALHPNTTPITGRTHTTLLDSTIRRAAISDVTIASAKATKTFCGLV